MGKNVLSLHHTIFVIRDTDDEDVEVVSIVWASEESGQGAWS